jgi:AcrR family transcriptional regulator
MVDTVLHNRAERRKQQTRTAIKQAAFDLLGEVGYQKLSIRAITERADIGYGTFYGHFSDKDDVVWEVVKEWSDAMMQQVWQRVAHEPHPRREYLSWVYTFEHLAATREGFVEMFGPGGSARLLQRYQDYVVTIHHSNLAQNHYSSGLNLPLEFLAQFMAGALVRLMQWWAQGNALYTAEEMAQLLFRAVYRAEVPLS